MRIILAFLLIGFSGCAPVDRAQRVKEVLKADPQFADVLQQRDEYASRIETAQREFALKRQTVRRAIEKLRQDLVDGLQTLKKKRAHYQQLLEPERKRLELARAMAENELRAKREQRAGIGRSITKLRKALKDTTGIWSKEEQQHQDAHLQEMFQDAQRLDREIDTLKAHINLLKTKALLLQL